MEVKIKKLIEKAVIPTKAHITDAGLDLTATSITTEIGEDGQLLIVYHTGLSMELPENHVALLFPRSSISKKSLSLCNAVGVIDSGYRGEVIAKFKTNTNVVPAVYKEGDKFAQLIILPYPEVEFIEVENVSTSDRNEGGFGSSDEKETTEE